MSAPIRPMFATAGREPFDSADWVFEIKWDGYRALAECHGDGLRLLSRRGNDLTPQFPELSQIAGAVRASDAVIDGEIVCMDSDGRSSFELLQGRGAPSSARRARTQVDFIAFDLLALDGALLLQRPLEERRDLLEGTLTPTGNVHLSPQIPTRGTALLEGARMRGLEGVIAKRLGSRYHPGRRSPDWIKFKLTRHQEAVIVGWIPGQGRRASTIGSLVVALMADGGLQYAGCVGTGFTDRVLDDLMARLSVLASEQAPIVPPDDADLRGVRWVRPELVCEIAYAEMTTRGRLRTPSYRGLRGDKTPQECEAP